MRPTSIWAYRGDQVASKSERLNCSAMMCSTLTATSPMTEENDPAVRSEGASRTSTRNPSVLRSM